MTAQIVGFVTREEAGLVPPTSRSTNINPEDGGVAIHYGGPAQRGANPGDDHALCIQTWKFWQKFHMDKDWADIAYTMGFCNHGYVFAGRGAGYRTAGQGTNDGNDRFYACVWIGGDGQTPTQLAYDAADWCVLTLRHTGAGMEVRPHQYFKSTACPGSSGLVTYAARRNGRVITKPAPPPTDPPKDPNMPLSQEDLRKIQLLVREETRYQVRSALRDRQMKQASAVWAVELPDGEGGKTSVLDFLTGEIREVDEAVLQTLRDNLAEDEPLE